MGNFFVSSSDRQRAMEIVKEEIANNPCVVFSKTYCPYCHMAKDNLKAEGAKFKVIELDQRDDGSAIQAALAELTGRRTVPNVFVGGKSIGGGDDTTALRCRGELKTILQEAGAL